MLTGAYAHLGFDVLADEGFAVMVLARIVEPTSKADTIRVLEEIGVPCPSLRTLFRALARAQDRDYRGALAKACLAHSARSSDRAALGLAGQGEDFGVVDQAVDHVVGDDVVGEDLS